MGKLTTFIILFNRENKCYSAGEEITGVVTVGLKKEKNVKKIKLKLKGRCEVNYTEFQNNDGEIEVVWRKSKEKYFEFEQKLFSDDCLSCGEHSFPFSFTLPGDIPSSYEGCNDNSLKMNIRYYAKCKMDSKKEDHETLVLFTVQQKMDLNSFPDCWEAKDAHDDKYICCLCCKYARLILL